MPAKIADEIWQCPRCGGSRRNKYGNCIDCKKKPVKTKEPCKNCGGTQRDKRGSCVACKKKSQDKSRAKFRAGLSPSQQKPCSRCKTADRELGYSHCAECRKKIAQESTLRCADRPCRVCKVNSRYRHSTGVETKCYDCILNDPKRIEGQLKKKYGMTLSEYRALYDAQNGQCAICNRKERAVTKSVLGLVVDHDHISGKVRGLLCSYCNQSVGLIDDDPKIADEMASYLREHGRA